MKPVFQPPVNLPLPLKMLQRDWRAGELRVLALALVIAVASVTSVAFFADRVWQAMTREANQMLGADVLLVSDHPFAADLREEIAKRGLARADGVSFVSMARARPPKPMRTGPSRSWVRGSASKASATPAPRCARGWTARSNFSASRPCSR